MNGRIEVEHLSKTFKKGNVTAVKDVSFQVEEGEFLHFSDRTVRVNPQRYKY